MNRGDLFKDLRLYHFLIRKIRDVVKEFADYPSKDRIERVVLSWISSHGDIKARRENGWLVLEVRINPLDLIK